MDDFCRVEMAEYESPVQISDRTQPLDEGDWRKMVDQDGRIVNESKVRKVIFKGGVNSKIRAEVWRFLFGLYPFLSTDRERSVLLAENYARYRACKLRWKEMMKTVDNGNEPTSTPIYIRECQQHERFRYNEPPALSLRDDIDEDQLMFLNITAQVNASRESIDLGALSKAIKSIDKDVPRTDRNHPFFNGIGNPNLLVLRDILITYAAYHKDVGYAQGMNDILSRFLVVLGSEAEAYCCFVNYMDSVKGEFLESGMMKKIELIQKLLKCMDEQLSYHFTQHSMGDLLFVHRWLILGFKREFSFEDSLILFEILSCQHLELHSLEAEKEREKQRYKVREKEGGEYDTELVGLNEEFTFDLFVCLAILKQYRSLFFKCTDVSLVYNVLSSLSMKMDLNIVLVKAEELFYRYCRKSVVDCFEIVDDPKS